MPIDSRANAPERMRARSRPGSIADYMDVLLDLYATLLNDHPLLGCLALVGCVAVYAFW